MRSDRTKVDVLVVGPQQRMERPTGAIQDHVPLVVEERQARREHDEQNGRRETRSGKWPRPRTQAGAQSPEGHGREASGDGWRADEPPCAVHERRKQDGDEGDPGRAWTRGERAGEGVHELVRKGRGLLRHLPRSQHHLLRTLPNGALGRARGELFAEARGNQHRALGRGRRGDDV